MREANLPELRLHYTTLGAARRDATGGIVNGVLLLHGTGGTGKQWLMPSLANELFGEGSRSTRRDISSSCPTELERGLKQAERRLTW